jgi:hypothetical protein
MKGQTETSQQAYPGRSVRREEFDDTRTSTFTIDTEQQHHGAR